eukprot:CAMPEP_0172495334 /NCGR_PEP_ID=MMETSP1066-20121228/67819_1 /TAXON_ID=671091 /ORGANISM="Coscinodiscus wailesii, Strain CCMP2513" /LENGTH=93 /DNA_ID=CAMNT_0013266919 /DNA_START=56 /DNA_END=337 /DNA_ORIENTATION=+
MNMMITKNKKVHMLLALAVLAVSLLENVEATNMRRDLSPFVTIRSLAENNDTSVGNSTNTTTDTDTSGSERQWMKSNAVAGLICTGLTWLYLV